MMMIKGSLAEEIASYVLHELSNTICALNINLEMLNSSKEKAELEVINEISAYNVSQIEYLRYMYGGVSNDKNLSDIIVLANEFFKYRGLKLSYKNDTTASVVVSSDCGKLFLAMIEMLAAYSTKGFDLEVSSQQSAGYHFNVLLSCPKQHVRLVSVHKAMDFINFVQGSELDGDSDNACMNYIRDFVSRALKKKFKCNLYLDNDLVRLEVKVAKSASRA